MKKPLVLNVIFLVALLFVVVESRAQESCVEVTQGQAEGVSGPIEGTMKVSLRNKCTQIVEAYVLIERIWKDGSRKWSAYLVTIHPGKLESTSMTSAGSRTKVFFRYFGEDKKFPHHMDKQPVD